MIQNQYQYLQHMIKVEQSFAEEILVQKIFTQQGREKNINYFEIGEYRGRDAHATYHNIRLYRSFSQEKVGDVFLLKKIGDEDPIFADKLSKNQLGVVGNPDKQIRDKMLKCQYHWKDNKNHYFAFENPAYGMLNQFLQKFSEYEERLKDAQIAYILKGILLALKKLHSSKIYHQNLKIFNIAVCENFDIKLHDFSFSKYKGFQNYNVIAPVTPRYSILSRKKIDSDEESDIQAFGVILYYLLYGMFPNQNGKNMQKNNKNSKITQELERIWKELHEAPQQLSIEYLLNCTVFKTSQSQDRNLQQNLLKKYSQYKEDLAQQKKWGRKADKTPIKLTDQQLQLARRDFKIEVSMLIRENQSLTIILSNRNVIKIKNKEINALYQAKYQAKKRQIESKEYVMDEFKEVNCTVSKFCIINDAIFLRLSNDLIFIAFPQPGKNSKNINEQVMMSLNYDYRNPCNIKLNANGKDQIFQNFEEGLAKEPNIMTYIKAVFQNMLQHSSISA